MRFFFIFLLCLFFIVFNKSENNYGPYTMAWTKLETCKGPKQGDCGDFKLENTLDPTDLIFRLNFPKDCPVTGAKVVISSRQQNNVMKKLWNYVLSKPCQHFVLGPIMTESFNITSNNCKVDKDSNYVLSKPCQHFVLGPIMTESLNLTSNNCKVDKGNYSIHLNFLEKSTMFLGSNFFYGTYSFKVMSFNKANNFFCVLSVIDIKKI